jgi:hypothetical protein
MFDGFWGSCSNPVENLNELEKIKRGSSKEADSSHIKVF